MTRMTINGRISRIQEVREEKSRLSMEENDLSEPFLTDLNQIDVIHEEYVRYLSDNGLENDSSHRLAFVFVVMYLYSVGSLAGGKMRYGIRDRIAQVTGCSLTLISHNSSQVMFQYSHYKDFRDEVDEILRRVMGRIPMREECFSRGGHIRGYQLLRVDGEPVSVESLKVGDVVMGDDGTPRNVIDVTHGHGRIVRIRPAKGAVLCVNENQVIVLFNTKTKVRVEMTALSLARQTPSHVRHLMLVRHDGELVRIKVNRVRHSEDYYGFTIDGNHLFRDGNGFIMHNV